MIPCSAQFCLCKWQFLMISPCPSKLLYFSALLVMQVMGQRLQVTEQRQQQMMTFLAKAMQNPAFLAQLMQQSESNKRLAATVRKKRRLPKQDEGGEDSLNADSPPDGQMMYLMSQCCIFLLHQLYTSRDLKVARALRSAISFSGLRQVSTRRQMTTIWM
jgi:hypothetical protein